MFTILSNLKISNVDILHVEKNKQTGQFDNKERKTERFVNPISVMV